MTNISLNNSIVGKQFFKLAFCHSTNDLALQKIKGGTGENGTLIYAEHQFAGRGQRGNEWQSNPGENLTFSLIFKPKSILPSEQFLISMSVALAISDFLVDIHGVDAQIKWPNDILVNEKKICGILIENGLKSDKIDYAVIGVGINVNQEIFHLETATSLQRITGQNYVLDDQLEEVSRCLNHRLEQLESGAFEQIQRDYFKQLFRYESVAKYRVENRTFYGKIIGVNLNGQLLMDTAGIVSRYNFKEIEYVFQDS